MQEPVDTNRQADRWNHIDLLECLGMFLVIFYHATTYSLSWMDKPEQLLYLRYYARCILSTCVPLFFFANGYLLLNRSFDFGKHVRKTLRILLLTVLWGGLTILCKMPVKEPSLTLKEMVLMILDLRLGWLNHLWYLGALFSIYIVFPLLKTAFDCNKKAFVFFTAVCAALTFGISMIDQCGVVLGLYGGAFRVEDFPLVQGFDPFLYARWYAFAYFCLGGLAHERWESVKRMNSVKRVLFPVLLLLVSTFGLFYTGVKTSVASGKLWDVVWNGYDSVFTLINVGLLFLLCARYDGRYKLIRLISTHSLGIYFIHSILLVWSKPWVMTFEWVRSMPGCFVYSVLILLCSLLLTAALSKIPIVRRCVKL